MKLFKHQKEILDLLTDNESFAVFAEAGTGKTAAMLFHLTNLLMVRLLLLMAQLVCAYLVVKKKNFYFLFQA